MTWEKTEEKETMVQEGVGKEITEQMNEKQTNVEVEKEKKERDEKFTKLFIKYKNLMFWTAQDVLNDEYMAEDAVQDAFLKVMRHLDQIGNINSAETRRYVSLAARNLAIDRYRQRTAGAEKELFAEDVEYLNEIEAEPYLEKQEGNRILDIINALPEIYREVCTMKYVKNMENREIAEKLNMREGTVRQRLFRGKALIERAIRELEKEENERIL